MVSNIEYIKLGITIITSIVSILGFYHKFIMKKIDEKVDQKLYDKEVDYMKTQTKYNYSNLDNKIQGVSDDIRIIKEFMIHKNKI